LAVEKKMLITQVKLSQTMREIQTTQAHSLRLKKKTQSLSAQKKEIFTRKLASIKEMKRLEALESKQTAVTSSLNVSDPIDEFSFENPSQWSFSSLLSHNNP